MARRIVMNESTKWSSGREAVRGKKYRAEHKAAKAAQAKIYYAATSQSRKGEEAMKKAKTTAAQRRMVQNVKTIIGYMGLATKEWSIQLDSLRMIVGLIKTTISRLEPVCC